MDHQLIPRVSKLIEDYTCLQKEIEGLKQVRNRYAVMKKPITFPSNDQLRLTEGNAEVGQIIMFKVKGETVYSVVTKINPSVVSVKDLILKINEKNYIEFYINEQVNIVHKGNLGYTRKIRIVNCEEYCVL